MLAGGVEMPFKGSDPRNPGKYKIFSAAEVIHDGELQGYLYTVLGGQKYDELASSIRSSYVRKISLGAIVAIVVTGFLVGLLVFGLLTRRLTVLTRSMQRFTASGFDPDFKLNTGQTGASAGDEIGCGISDEDLEHIFDRFYHADQGGDSDSTGLGLAIVKRILDLHGSRITVQSSPNRGTRFEFELPSQKAA